jgi:hypothetical protein
MMLLMDEIFRSYAGEVSRISYLDNPLRLFAAFQRTSERHSIRTQLLICRRST